MSLTVKASQEYPCRVVSVDSEITGSRYVVSVVKSVNQGYIVSVPNFAVSFETTNPQHIDYKLVELGLSNADARQINEIVKNMMV